MESTTNEALLGWMRGINAVELSPDARRFAVAGNASAAALYDADAQLIAELAHHGSVQCVAFRPDGERLATAGNDMGVRIWTLDGQLVALLKGHLNAVFGLAWSADGSLLASASRDGAVRVWAMTPEEAVERWVATALESRPNVVAWLGDELVIGAERSVEVRGAGGAERFRVDTGFVRRVHASEDGRFVAAEHHRWEQRTRVDTVSVWTAQLEEIWSGPGLVCALGRGSFAVACGDIVTARALPGATELWITAAHDGGVLSLAARDDGSWITGGNDTLACAIAADGTIRGVIRHDQAVRFCASAKGAVLTATGAGSTCLWSDADLRPAPPPAPTREPTARIELGAGCNSAAFAADGERFAVSSDCAVELRRSRDGTIDHRFDCDEQTWAVQWDGDLVSARLQESDGRRVWSARGAQHVTDLPDAFHFDISGGIAVAGSEPLRVYRVTESPAGFELLATHDADKYGTTVSPSGRYVLIAADEGGILLDTKSGESTRLHEGESRNAAFSPDETRLVASADGDLTLWRLDELRAPRTLELGPVWQLAWSPGGDRLAIGTSDEHTVVLRGDGAHVATLGERLQGAVNPVFSGDGEILATGGRGGPAALWRARDAQLIATLGGLATSHIKVVPVAGDTRWLTHANVSPAGDLALKLWSREGQPVATLPGHSGDHWWQVNISPCSNWIVSIVWGDRPRVWSARDGSLWGALDGLGTNVRVGVFGPPDAGGRVRLVTGGDDGVLALWDVGD